jgi:membrane protein YdbS with pleckstrin-like domain
MNIPGLGKRIDERFVTHRLQATRIAGVSGVVVAVGLFEYRYFFQHIWSWDLLAVAVTVVVVKMGLMVWYHFTD